MKQSDASILIVLISVTFYFFMFEMYLASFICFCFIYSLARQIEQE